MRLLYNPRPFTVLCLGRVVSFTRGCDENPLISNEIRTDAHYTKYYRTCKTRKCNSGDGILGMPKILGNEENVHTI
jgi:hypothetical protein